VKLTYWLFISLFVTLSVQAADDIPLSEVTTPSEVVVTTPIPNEAVEHGKELHNPECVTSCHSPKSYISENRKVKDFAHLNTFVQMCATNLDKSWFEEDVADVANYLNTEYYKFPVE